MNKPIHFTIRGNLVSLKNSRDIGLNRKTGRRFPLKNAAIEAFSRDFALQLPPEYRQLGLQGPLAVTVEVWYPSERHDLSCDLVYDLLQSCGVIGNDRQIIEKHEYRHCDRLEPRVSVRVSQTEETAQP